TRTDVAGAHHDHVDDDIEEQAAGCKPRLRAERHAVVTYRCEREPAEVEVSDVERAERRLPASLQILHQRGAHRLLERAGALVEEEPRIEERLIRRVFVSEDGEIRMR